MTTTAALPLDPRNGKASHTSKAARLSTPPVTLVATDRYDITDVANCGGRNILAVKVDASQTEGWFYEGAGIYRHVWLVKTAPGHAADSMPRPT